jgi:hypothetical protein
MTSVIKSVVSLRGALVLNAVQVLSLLRSRCFAAKSKDCDEAISPSTPTPPYHFVAHVAGLKPLLSTKKPYGLLAFSFPFPPPHKMNNDHTSSNDISLCKYRTRSSACDPPRRRSVYTASSYPSTKDSGPDPPAPA